MKTEDEMTSDIRHQLRVETDHLTLNVAQIDKIGKRLIRRRRIYSSIVGSTVVLIVASVTIAVLAAPSLPSHRSAAVSPKMRSAAYIIRSASQALDSIESTTIVHIHSSVAGDLWSYQHRSRHEYGQPRIDVAISTQNGMTTTVSVNYGIRAWSTETRPSSLTTLQLQPDGNSCGVVLNIADVSSASAFRQALIQQRFSGVPGSPSINGQTTNELAEVCGGATQAEVFLNAESGLPIRVVLNPASTVETTRLQLDYVYVPATSANTTLLQAPIPSGFTQIPPPTN